MDKVFPQAIVERGKNGGESLPSYVAIRNMQSCVVVKFGRD